MPSNDLRTVGVLLRQFDKLDDGLEGKPWLPCPTDGWASWCGKFNRIWAASIVTHGGATQLYRPFGGGLVLAPTTHLLCAYPADGNSMNEEKLCDDTTRWQTCTPGCTCPPGTVAGPGSCYEGRPANQLRQVMSEHLQSAPLTNGYNEMVVDVDSVARHLPYSVEAFFYARGGDEGEVRAAHAEFLRSYPELGNGRETGRSVPLVEVDLSAEAPFRLSSW